MSIELLRDISKVLDYHSGEFRALSVPAQADIDAIRHGIARELIIDHATTNGQAGPAGIRLPAKKKVSRKAKKK